MKIKLRWFGLLARLKANAWNTLAILIILAGVSVRLIDLTDQPLDFHPTRQLLNALITRGIYYELDPALDPTLRESVQQMASSLERDEPPVLNGLVALTYLLVGEEVLWIARLYTILFWTIGGVALYALARRIATARSAVVSLVFYLFLPFSIFASRSFMVDSLMVLFLVLSALSFYRWAETGGWKWAVFTGILFGLTILVKVTAFFPLFGMAASVILTCSGFRKAFKSLQVWIILFLAGLPGFLYYFLGRGGSASGYFLFWTVSMWDKVLDPAYYIRWLSFVGSFIGLSILFLGFWGMVIAPRLGRALLLGLWIGYGVYGLFFPFQILTHDYYHLMLVPILALSLAPPAEALMARLAVERLCWQVLAGCAAFLLVFYPAWVARSALVASDYRTEPGTWQAIGDSIPTDGRFIALTNDYGFPLMYYGWKTPSALWPMKIDFDLMSARGDTAVDIQALFADRTQGMRYFLVTMPGELENQPELNQILSHYQIIEQGDGYQVYNLDQPLP
jgi:hypothetical protein